MLMRARRVPRTHLWCYGSHEEQDHLLGGDWAADGTPSPDRLHAGRPTVPQPMVYTTPYPYFHQLGLPPSSSPEEHTRAALHQLHLLFKQAIRPDSVAAIIIEPLLGVLRH